MWTIYIVKPDEFDGRASAAFDLILSNAKGHKNEKAYRENLTGLKTNLKGNNKYCVIVADDSGVPQVLCLATFTGSNIDLSEIVKNPNCQGSAPIWALMAWAVNTAQEGKLTLTAAYLILVKIYRTYGFEAQDLSHPMLKIYGNKIDQHLDVTVNLPMVMGDDKKKEISEKYPVDQYWKMG